MKLFSSNPLRTLLNRLWILLSYTPFLRRFLLFLRAKTRPYLMHRACHQGSTQEGEDSQPKSLQFYLKAMSQQLGLVFCHHCGDLFHSETFQKHLSEARGSTPDCVWCEQISETAPDKLDLIPVKPLTPQNLAQGPDTRPSPFQNNDLNLAAAYVLRFFQPRETHVWYHITLTGEAVGSFFDAVKEDEGHTHTLPFSCWCHAGKYHADAYRNHRHVIVIAPSHHFEQHVWPKVTVPEEHKPDPSYSYKSLTRIETPMQLVDLLGSLTSEESTCEKGEWQRGNKFHYHFHMTLPADYKLPLVLLWDGGLEELLYERRFKNADLSRVMKRPVSFVDGKWRQKIKDFYNLQRGRVVPVSRALKPTQVLGGERPLYTFHLLEGKKVYFYHSEEMASLDEKTWRRRQAEGGNCFYDNIGEAMWTMSPKDQERLSRMMPRGKKGRKGSAKEGTKEEQQDEASRDEEAMKTDMDSLKIED